MTNAGLLDSQYAIVVQDYESPLPTSSGFRYGESGYTRQNTGGCGFWNNDANWANNTALPTINNAVKNAATQTGLTNIKIMELQNTFNGRRLCENTVGLLEEKGLSTWQSAGAVDNSEWIEQIRTVSTVFGPYYVQESLHPNYWGREGAAQLRAPGLQRRYAARRHVHPHGQRAERQRRAEHDAPVVTGSCCIRGAVARVSGGPAVVPGPLAACSAA